MSDRRGELSALLSSAALMLVGGAIASGAKLGERVVVGRLLSPDAYGEVSIGFALLTFTLTLALAGITQGVSRFVPRYDDERDKRGVWIDGVGITTALSIAFALAMFVGAERIAALFFETDEAVTFVRLLAATLPFLAAFRISMAAVRGMENTVYYTALRNVGDPLSRIGLIALFIALGMGIVAAGAAYLVATLAMFVLGHVVLSRLIEIRGPFTSHAGELVRFSAPLVVATVFSVLLTRTDTLMLGYFRSSAEVGMYEAAYPLAGGLLVVLEAFGFLYLPMASRLDAADDRSVVDDIYATTTKWIYVVTFPGFLVLAIFPGDVVRVFFGPAYADAARVLPILALGFFLSAAAGRDRETLSAVGATTWIAVGNVAGLAVNVLLNLVLIPRYGMMGAGYASVSSLIAVHLVVTGVLAIRYDITPLSPSATRAYVGLPAILLPWFALLSPALSITAATLLPVLVATGIASLAALAIVGGFEPDDVVVIEAIEDATGVSIPLIRQAIPDDAHDGLTTSD